MPNLTYRQIAGKNNYKRRRNNSKERAFSKIFDLSELDNSLEHVLQDQQQETLPPFKKYLDVECQTDETGIDFRFSEIHQKLNFGRIRDLIYILFDLIPNFGAIHYRLVSVIIYLILRLLYLPWRKCQDILKSLDLLDIQKCHMWTNTMIDEDDLFVILRDGRKGHKKHSFYDEFPDIEAKAKAFSMDRGSSKKCDFSVNELAVFVDKIFRDFYSVTIEKFGFESKKLIRSEESCRLDLLRWGAKFSKNSNRPYFEGHEREDVVEKRKEFCQYFIQFKDQYFYPFLDQECKLAWNRPLRKVRILLSHDESTYKSGEVSMFRWLFPGMEPFYSKGRGRSIMLSQFLVQHNFYDIFSLCEQEWKKAVAEYPELDEEDEFLNFFPRSPNAWIEPKKDHYFDNKVILKQFERLFILLKYKDEFKNCEIEIIVDNARTHNARKYDAILFNKKPGTNCPYEVIEWNEGAEIKK